MPSKVVSFPAPFLFLSASCLTCSEWVCTTSCTQPWCSALPYMGSEAAEPGGPWTETMSQSKPFLSSLVCSDTLTQVQKTKIIYWGCNQSVVYHSKGHLRGQILPSVPSASSIGLPLSVSYILCFTVHVFFATYCIIWSYRWCTSLTVNCLNYMVTFKNIKSFQFTYFKDYIFLHI
jgi:hypothetical protein